jgi:hypothetical protein
VRDDGVREEKKEFSYLSSSLPENLKPSLLYLVPIYSSKISINPSSILASSTHGWRRKSQNRSHHTGHN